MKKKILAMTMSGAMAATMMTIGSTNAWAEPITVKDIPSQFGAQQSSQTNPKFIGFVADVADAVLSTGSQVRAAATHVAGDQWTGMAAGQAWDALSAMNMARDGFAALGAAKMNTSDKAKQDTRAGEVTFDNK
ncbi:MULTISPECIES: hypothetical protein [Bacillus]|uniref:hypothetical protein n=1 Tax=Bacillus TaxID=1386 RepID=UPI00077A3494|nr:MULTISPECIES: hypothetical protein [Bacillus cereus group]KXY85465.1 hypothetical protein AT270_30095 [Bacillus cereus]MBG9937740.1 hypothetical protein [Bacillus tropicus]MED2997384.1 hypothetical protein [Bacillus tropicus]OTY55542.1 hypothetical protein BK748_16745 [Bacillus thuringiensis serovar graciosensis]